MTYGTITNGIDVTITREPTTAFGITKEPVTDLPIRQFNQLDINSVEYRTAVQTNLIKNPSFEVNVTGWTQFNGTLTRITSDFYFGTSCAQFVSNTTAAGSFLTTRNATYQTPITPGRSYTTVAYFKRTVGSRNNRIQIITRNTPAGATVQSFTSPTINAVGWTKLSFTVTPTNALGLFLEVNLGTGSTGAIGDTFLADGVIVTESSSNPYYWDGSTNDLPIDFEPVTKWTGTANNSTSILTYEQEGTLTISETVLR